MTDIKPIDVHKEPIYWGKTLPEMLDMEVLQIYENLINAEKKREAASKHPKFNVDREENGKTIKRLILPPINTNYQAFKDAIINEMKKRNIEP